MTDREIGALLIVVGSVFGFKYLYNGALGVSGEGGLFAQLPALVGLFTVGVAVAVVVGVLIWALNEI